jgi:hypothetical protein
MASEGLFRYPPVLADTKSGEGYKDADDAVRADGSRLVGGRGVGLSERLLVTNPQPNEATTPDLQPNIIVQQRPLPL